MKKLLLILLLLIGGCGTYSESVQVSDKAYLLLIGNPYGSVVTIDNLKPINLQEDTTSFSLNGRQATKIEIPTGTHTVNVTRNGQLLVNRKFFVSNGSSFEVEL